MSVQAIADILKATWGLEPGARLLHVGAGAGHMVAALRALGFDATGVESSRAASSATPPELAPCTFHCDFASLPFENQQFDAVIETGLYRTAPHDAPRAIAELHRVAKHGLLLGSVTTDLTIELIERFNLLEGTRILCSRWDWAEKLYAAGFAHALFDPSRLGAAWEKVEASGVGPGWWYDDSESLLYCVYERGPRPGSSGVEAAPTAVANPSQRDPTAAKAIDAVSAVTQAANAIRGQ